MGYLGRLHPKKNVSTLIEAGSRLDDDVSLVIAGRGDAAYERALTAQAERLLPGRAKFIGWVSGDDKTRFLSDIDVLAMPSEYECFGVAAVEALAAGTPVIVSDRVGVADIVREHGGGRVVPADHESLAAAIQALLDDRSVLASMAAKARDSALAHASFSAHGAKLASAYAQVCGESR